MSETKIISFGCLGTLIDWKDGALNTLRPLFKDYLIDMADEEIFKLFLEFEKDIIAQDYISYRCVLQSILKRFASLLNINFSNDDLDSLVRSFPNWKVFPDTVESITKLKEKYKLAVIANIDYDLLEKCSFFHEVKFDWVLTSEDMKSYKPSPGIFTRSLNIFNAMADEVIHVAQSIFHDIEPSIQLGMKNVWINRYSEIYENQLEPEPELSFHDLSGFVKNLLKSG
jgi:2-haloacid dehalogenase